MLGGGGLYIFQRFHQSQKKKRNKKKEKKFFYLKTRIDTFPLFTLALSYLQLQIKPFTFSWFLLGNMVLQTIFGFNQFKDCGTGLLLQKWLYKKEKKLKQFKYLVTQRIYVSPVLCIKQNENKQAIAEGSRASIIYIMVEVPSSNPGKKADFFCFLL